MKKRVKMILILLLIVMFYPNNVRANWADCYATIEKDDIYSVGDVVTLVLGSEGATYGTNIYGFHYYIQYDPEILSPVEVKNGGIGSYFDWEIVNMNNVYDNTRYEKILVDVRTADQNKFYNTSDGISSDKFVKLGYVKFKINNVGSVDSTKLILTNLYKPGENSFDKNTMSYKYILDTYFSHEYIEEPCVKEINAFVNLKDTAYINSIKINGTEIDNFDRNNYTYNLSYKDKNIDIVADVNSMFKISGDIGKKTLSDGINKFKIIVDNQRGIKKEYFLNVSYQDNKSDDNTLKFMQLSHGSLSFDSEVFSYDVVVDKTIDKIRISSELNDENASYVDNFGNREVDLKLGKNEILVKVKSQKGTERVYTINVIRRDYDIKDIKIKDYDLNFEKGKKKYTLNINKDDDKLDITVIMEDENVEYQIIGNHNLNNGSVVIIRVFDGQNRKEDYIIGIEKFNPSNSALLVGFIISITIISIAAVAIYLKKKNK